MPVFFLRLPGEIRNEIYKHLLVRKVPIDPWNAAAYELGPQILATNSKIYREAIQYLYSDNCFDLTRYKSDLWDYPLVPGFLNSLTPRNQSLIQNLQINFPDVSAPSTTNADGVVEVGEVSLEKESLESMQMIQKCCTDLRSITVPVESSWFWERWATDSDQHRESVALLDSHFRAITSLKRIVVQVHVGEKVDAQYHWSDDPYWPSMERRVKLMRKQMQGLGWVLEEVVDAEDEDWYASEDVEDSEDDEYDSDEEDLEYSEGEDCLESESGLADLLEEAKEIIGETRLDVRRVTS
ncbi:hypothetical protein MYU51_011477 [Penicillium brevicompactum]